MSQPLKVDTDALERAKVPASQPSAIITIPPGWAESPISHSMDHSEFELSPKDTSTGRFRNAGDVHIDSTLPLSSSSSSSLSGHQAFGWPPSGSSVSRPDPFERTRSFSEDPFGAQSSSSSSGDDNDFTAMAAMAASAPAIVLPRSTSELPTSVGPAVPERGTFHRAVTSPLPNRAWPVRQPLEPRPPKGMRVDPVHSVSVELVDSLQTAIQTILNVSPPHLLDNAKEQYSGCAIQVPVTSVSALLSSMRGLNYLSANLGPMVDGQGSPSSVIEDFDVGELVQNVADQLSGEAAQTDVELVLFHGDVGIKHISVNGDREALGFALCHVLRQILLVATKGDTIELGLQVYPQSPSVAVSRRDSLPVADRDRPQSIVGHHPPSPGKILPSPPTGLPDDPTLCTFEIVHNISQTIDSNAATPRAELNPFARLVEQKEAATPKFDSVLSTRLLRQANAWLKTNAIPSSPTSFGIARHAYELSTVLPPGRPILEPVKLTVEEEANRQPFTDIRLPREPTLAELSDFAETLRGRSVHLHASHSSVFARHLTSYLQAWGIDVSLIPVEVDILPASQPTPNPQFILIDSDIATLRRELARLKSDTPLGRQRSLKRPGLTRSGKSTQGVRQTTLPTVIHFTGLEKYRQVRDLLASSGFASQVEVLVVPKPVGPRRFLTALFTAVRQPLVDPAFSPIATSPRSPQVITGNRAAPSSMQTGFFDGVNALENQAPTPRSARTPLAELPPPLGLTPRGDALKIPMSTPLGDIETTPAAEYFSRATNGKSSGASGVVMQSPDGRPFGMYFEPPASGGGSGHHPETSRRKGSARRLSGETDGGTAATSPTSSPAPSRRASAVSNATDDSSGFEGGRSQPPQPRRKMLPAAPDAKPLFARGRGRSSTITKRQSGDGVTSPHNGKPLPDINEKKEVARNAKSDVVVPPINVLIVEDNPINQNILSMFFRKKKIKHQTAKDGVEAVEKWKTGGFHLILMDIQLPVMDGIEATKEIRKLERGQNIGVFPGTPVSDHAKSAIDAAPLSPFRSAVIIVALTASSLQTDRVAALAAGCNDFLTKPVSLKWLERKTIEWGCMQALIDFDGWRRWKGSDVRDPAETKMAFQIGPQANARAVASRLRIDRSKGRPSPPTVTPPASVPPAPSPPAATKAEANTGTSHQSSTEKPLPALPVE